MTTIFQENAALSATTRTQHATAASNAAYATYNDDLAACTRMWLHGIDSSVVTYCAGVAYDMALGELERLARFASAS